MVKQLQIPLKPYWVNNHMFIDSCLVAIIIWAFIQGWKQGLVVAAFSYAAVFIGMAAAVKLSALVANWLGNNFLISMSWLPFMAFIIIMTVVIILVRMLAKLIETTLQFSMLGWLNIVGGIGLYLVLYISVFSVLIFYLEKMHLLKPKFIHESVGYTYINYWGPKSIEIFGKAIPLFKDMFSELSTFFEALQKKLK